jgi:aldehyde dehydrogenase (NAD+)
VQPNFIGGSWVEADEAIADVNPSDLNDVVGEYAAASETQADEAIAAAAAAGPGWAAATPGERAVALEAIGLELQARSAELGELLSREEGKPRAEGVGEVLRASQIFRFFAGEALRVKGEHLRSVRPGVDVDLGQLVGAIAHRHRPAVPAAGQRCGPRPASSWPTPAGRRRPGWARRRWTPA